MNKLFAYLPCYNESGNIRPLTLEWLAEAEKLRSEGYELLVLPIDDASTDDTLSILQALDREYEAVRHLSHPVNKNLGGVLTTAVHHFLDHSGEGDLMCFMDGDDTHKPEFVHGMLQKLSGPTCCVIASRYQPGAAVQGLTRDRELFSSCARLYYTALLHVPHVRDYTCGYRLYTRGALAAGVEKYGDELIENKSFACMMELLYKLHRAGCTFEEVPFTLYYDAKEGESKMDLGKTIHDSLLTALRLRFRTK